MAHLNSVLVSKVARKRGIKESTLRRSTLPRQAAKWGISTEAALLVLARDSGLGIASLLKRAEQQVQAEVRHVTPQLNARGSVPAGESSPGGGPSLPTEQEALRHAMPYLLSHETLRARSADLLRKRKHLDRAVQQASILLDRRLREISGIKKSEAKTGHDLVVKALNPEKGVLRVSDDGAEREAFFLSVRGFFGVVRNPAIHEGSDQMSPWDALRLCGFVDYLLTRIEAAEVKI